MLPAHIREAGLQLEWDILWLQKKLFRHVKICLWTEFFLQQTNSQKYLRPPDSNVNSNWQVSEQPSINSTQSNFRHHRTTHTEFQNRWKKNIEMELKKNLSQIQTSHAITTHLLAPLYQRFVLNPFFCKLRATSSKNTKILQNFPF